MAGTRITIGQSKSTRIAFSLLTDCAIISTIFGRYKDHDWTVKVDPDCVFFADRLRNHINDLRPPPYMPLYLKNNDMDPGLGNRGFLGAVEIFSTIAMQT